jgi:hypothetical protein
MKKILLMSLLFSYSLVAIAAPPTKSLLDTCVSGKSQNEVHLDVIPFDTINETDNYWRNYTANYTEYRGKEIGYAKKGNLQGISYEKKVYAVSGVNILNTTKTEYLDLQKRGLVDLNQPADWYWLTEKDNGSYICVALNRSMEKATPLIYLLSISEKPKRLYFYVGDVDFSK